MAFLRVTLHKSKVYLNLVKLLFLRVHYFVYTASPSHIERMCAKYDIELIISLVPIAHISDEMRFSIELKFWKTRQQIEQIYKNSIKYLDSIGSYGFP